MCWRRRWRRFGSRWVVLWHCSLCWTNGQLMAVRARCRRRWTRSGSRCVWHIWMLQSTGCANMPCAITAAGCKHALRNHSSRMQTCTNTNAHCATKTRRLGRRTTLFAPCLAAWTPLWLPPWCTRCGDCTEVYLIIISLRMVEGLSWHGGHPGAQGAGAAPVPSDVLRGCSPGAQVPGAVLGAAFSCHWAWRGCLACPPQTCC